MAQAVGEHKALLIGSGVRVETGDLGYTVFTDRKWAVFLLGQLLQNSARYSAAEPVVTISVEHNFMQEENPARGMGAQPLVSRGGNKVRLCVRDNGIGIPAHELSRVFERGFTGSNGRVRGGSTGMGLYLCRRLADCLGIGLEIMSECGVGTTVVLVFEEKKELGTFEA